MFKSLVSAGLLAAAVSAQQTVDFVDEVSGIEFQNHAHESTGVEFGVALPSEPSSDFIGRVSAPISEGYVAVSLGGNMIGRLLVVAWPNGDEVVSSFRQAAGYSNPSVVTESGLGLKTIPSGTSIDDDSFTWTFVCEGCITGDATAFLADDETTVFGWALSDTEVADPSDPESALNMHSAGFGLYGADLVAARSADYDSWAALAEDATGTPGNGTVPEVPEPIPGNGTTPGVPSEPPTTSPTPISPPTDDEETTLPTPPSECARRRKLRKMRKAKRAAAKAAKKVKARRATVFRA